MNFMENNSQSFIVYKGMPEIKTQKKFNLILPPQLYTLRKEALPVKFAYEVKKVASSFFEGLRDDSSDLDFFVYKENDVWVIIAYNLKEIKLFLEEAGVPLEKIKKIYFSDQLSEYFKNPIKIGDSDFIVNLNGVNTQINKSFLSTNLEESDFSDNIIYPKKGVTLNLSSEGYLDTKTTKIISSMLIMISLIYLIEGFHYSSIESVSSEEITDKTLTSSYTRKSILSKYKKIDKEEKAKRNLIKKLSLLVTKKIKVNDFELINNRYILTLVSPSKTEINILKNKAINKGFSPKINGNKIIIEGEL